VEGKANSFDGSQIHAGRASNKVYLINGGALVLRVNSAGTIYHDDLEFTRCYESTGMAGYAIHARADKCSPPSPRVKESCAFEGDTQVIAALHGTLESLDARVVLLTRLQPVPLRHSHQVAVPTRPGLVLKTNRIHRLMAYFPVYTGVKAKLRRPKRGWGRC
jgi:hypothetical protein